MKKGLSILLVAAALFGFYGSAVNLNDILACKDYWEEAGEKSTADMNKLEDGLNQLKENEQAYLDGKDQLAEGEQTLADGEAQYAKGLADYEAAPGKLAAGERKLAKGEQELADGEDSYKKLKTLIAGLNEIKKHGTGTTSTHDTYWHDGFSHEVSKDVLAKIASGQKTSDSPGLRQARKVIASTLAQSKDDVKLIEGLTGTSDIVSDAQNASSYSSFNKAMGKAYKAFDNAEAQITAISKMARTYSATIGSMLDGRLASNTKGVPQSADLDADNNFTNTVPFNQCNLEQLGKGIAVLNGVIGQLDENLSGMQSLSKGIKDLENAIAKIEAAGGDASEYKQKLAALNQQKDAIESKNGGVPLDKLIEAVSAKKKDAADSKALLEQAKGGRETAQGMIQKVIDDYGDKLEIAAAGNSDLAALYGLMKAIANNAVINPSTGSVVGKDESNVAFYGYMTKLAGGLEQAADTLDAKIPVIQASKKSFNDWMNGYKTLADGKDGKGSSDLASTSNGIPFAFSSMLTNPTIKSAIKTYDKGLAKELKKYSGANKYKLKNEDLDKFDSDLVYIATKIVPRAQKVLAKVKSSANKQLASGRKQLAAGRKQLAQGRADYASAPGKLADAEQQLADGRQQLADGKAQLAQYEDGEQQVRDGLATLVGTEPDLSLESISDRLNGDTDFDNGDEHLDIDEGLAAVDVGRGYQADDGVLITDEIMARAVGTGALLGAGALALLAAILSFLKKNKGAGVFALLAAAAGAFGAYYGTNAGTYFSDIAGSTAGNAGWVAAGILGVVALVHAIVHFTAKKEA